MQRIATFLRKLGRNRVLTEVPDPWKVLADAPDAVAADSRVIYTGRDSDSIQSSHCGNSINTAKYNVITFLPIFLFTMFSRVAYLYFLSQCALAYWSTISPFSPYGPTIALVFVLAVAAIKAIVEDKKRHDEDRKTNNTAAHRVLEDGSVKDCKWRDIKVGQILEVRDNENFPADLLCLACARPDGVAYIRTTNLDGESNLKIRRPVNLRDDTPSNVHEAVDLNAILTCEPPNPDLHTFLGKFSYQPKTDRDARGVVGLSMDEILLRGCTLKNSKTIQGLVIYTGPETRIQQNAAAPPRKLGSYDGFLNVQIILVLILQVSLCLGCAIGSYVWRESYGKERYHLALDSGSQGNYQNGWAYVAVVFLTFWILFSYTIPISLFVTMEIIKFVLSSIFITFDPHMRDRVGRELPKARNSDIVEDLGLVDYIFSDKTGTLTSNEMQLRLLAIKESSFGAVDFKLEKQSAGTSSQNLNLFDAKLSAALASLRQRGLAERLLASGGSPAFILGKSSTRRGAMDRQVAQYLHAAPESRTPAVAYEGVGGGPLLRQSPQAGVSGGGSIPREQEEELLLGHHLLDFWTNICVCHNLITEENAEGGPPVYQGPSPDEVALVLGGRQLGFEFVERSRRSLTIRMLGQEMTHQVLNSLDFTSSRARMSVVARAPDGTIRLYCKGADNIMVPRLRQGIEPGLLASTQEHLRLYSVQVRTKAIHSQGISTLDFTIAFSDAIEEEGLRTLLICTRVMPEDEWVAFNTTYQAAAASIDDREQRLAAVAETIEQDFELVGVTAIEDKLQEGVPQAITTLVNAGIKVVMITGDKQETAINIATSCKLISNPEKLLLCNAPFSEEGAHAKLRELLSVLQHTSTLEFQEATAPKRKRSEMVIDGQTMARLLGNPESEMLLASLIVECQGVIVCRASPAQKAAILNLMKRFHAVKESGQNHRGLYKLWRRITSKLYAGLTGKHAGSSMRMLAIGDGANDVAMIQAAHIGVGIMGHEGRQATNNSDFAISQFRFLLRLLLVHGSLTTYRLARLIKYSFYKNVCFAFMLFFYQIFCGFSGQALLDGITAAFYNAAFTALPVAAFAIWDRPLVNLNLLTENPQTYNRKPYAELTARGFWKTGLLQGLVHGAVVFFVPYLSLATKGVNTLDDVFSIGKTMFIAIIGTVSVEIALVSRFWTRIFTAAWSLSYILTFPWLIIIPLLYEAFGAHNVAQYGIGNYLLGNATFWFSLLLVYIITGSLRVVEKAIHQIWMPNDVEILSEYEKLQPKHGGPLASKASRDLELQQHTNGVNGSGGVENGKTYPSIVHRSQNSTDRRWMQE